MSQLAPVCLVRVQCNSSLQSRHRIAEPLLYSIVRLCADGAAIHSPALRGEVASIAVCARFLDDSGARRSDGLQLTGMGAICCHGVMCYPGMVHPNCIGPF